jgi:K+/H+ antiporter YhaU regulatory subunit KhtT
LEDGRDHTDLEDDFVGIVNEIPLPGIDVRYELVSDDGARLGVVHHRSESRSWCSSSVRIQTCRTTSFDAEESRTLAELLGVSQVAKDA